MTQQIDLKMLRKMCLADMPWFEQFGHVVKGAHGNYIYKDNGTHILAVAHLDSVNQDRHFFPVTIRNHTIVYNAQLDDRLGAYVILDLLPKLGIITDILLTEGEETGQSTAQDFTTTKKYKWMFQFDRHGDDVVTYKYGEDSFKKMLRKVGFNKQEWGSFTDICELDKLGCRGFNVGCGYHNEHDPWCYFEASELVAQVNKFVAFYRKYSNVHIPYIYKAPAVSSWSKYNQSSWGHDDWDYRGIEDKVWSIPNQRWEKKEHLPGSFAYWDKELRIGMYYNYTGQAVSKEQWNREQAEAQTPVSEDDGAYVETLVCKGCMRDTKTGEESSKYPEFCIHCEPEIVECVACNWPVMKNTVDEFGMCKVCREETEGGHCKMTTVRCPECHNRLMTLELLKGVCWTCSKKSSIIHLPKEGSTVIL